MSTCVLLDSTELCFVRRDEHLDPLGKVLTSALLYASQV